MQFHEKIGYGHLGAIDGFISGFRNFLDVDVSYAIISNGLNFNIYDVGFAVLSTVFNKPYDIPVFKTYEVTSEDLDKYLGVYSSPDFPLKITITKDDHTLIAQATGQPSFPLEATEKDKFNFYRAGLVLIFNPSENSMILKQRGGEFTLKKE